MNGKDSTPPENLSGRSDAELVVLFRAGHLRSGAYQELMVVRYGAALLVWAKFFARGPLRWEDLEQSVHEVMLDQRLASYNPARAAFPGFLFIVVRSVSRSLLRRERYTQTCVDRPEREAVDETALEVALREAERLLCEEVGKLEGLERAVMEMCFRGRSRAETCAELKLILGDYDKAIAAARVKLRDRLPGLCSGMSPQTRGRPKKDTPIGASGDGSAEGADA